MTDGSLILCCEEFRSAVEVTFANAVDGSTGWLLYGTDHDTVISGQPELRYWPVRFCPFCGARLPRPPAALQRSPRRFDADPDDTPSADK